jgi:hypothetical protein
VRLLHRDFLGLFRDVRRVSLTPYYRISLKAARGVCNTVPGRADERNARTTAGFARAEGSYRAMTQVS